MNAPDTELAAMAQVAEALRDLDDDAVVRVLRWAGDRYGVVPSGSASPAQGDGGREASGDSPEDIGALFADAHLRTDADRALLAAYWFQHFQEARGWTGQQVNGELRQMGVGASNITHVLNRLINRRPGLVQQLSKSGRSKQARKQYRLTTAGLAAARALLEGGG